jgi:hypothetical protein
MIITGNIYRDVTLAPSALMAKSDADVMISSAARSKDQWHVRRVHKPFYHSEVL